MKKYPNRLRKLIHLISMNREKDCFYHRNYFSNKKIILFANNLQRIESFKE